MKSVGLKKILLRIAQIFLFIVVSLFLVKVVPNIVPVNLEPRKKVKATGISVTAAEERYYIATGRFTTDMKELATIDESLVIDPGMTLTFVHVSDSGFTLYVRHRKWRHNECFGTSLKFVEYRRESEEAYRQMEKDRQTERKE